MAAIVLALAAGCGGGFKDSAEELRYLESVASPSVEQFRRREELRAETARKKGEKEDAEYRGRTKTVARARKSLEEARQFEGRAIPASIDLLDAAIEEMEPYKGSSVYGELVKERDRRKALVDGAPK